ncbi:MAG: cell division protein FtsW [Gammaproteobacteria bacterium RIFCSPHIGHO2_12_FULL_35_23]|nr:MAG: cell division protein FtsW [Gammaproteobacteria bacterium RIFCSPHIGHO2_12_FULL_35_23]
MTTKQSSHNSHLIVDQYFVAAAIAILALGLLMVASASMVISERQFGAPFYYLFRQLAYVIMGVFLAFIVVRVEIAYWLRMGGILLLLGMFLLVMVLIPGIGHEANGSVRWIGFGFINLQVSEFIKLAVVIYMAGYLVRRHEEVCTRIRGFLKPMLILGIIAILLLKEPDFGALVVVGVTVLGMMYMGGVRVWQFIVLVILVVIAFAILAISSPYRMQRLTTFLNPWANAYNSGYQLTQSLIAFGHGGIFGVGLGGSIQKLFYLPEAHTDFLFAVLAEELGLIGVLITIALYVVLVGRALLIGKRAQLAGFAAAGFMAYGFAIWLAMQAAVNIGVTGGLFPTKGLTLPLMSYGGSSMMIDCIVIAILLRIDYEVRTGKFNLFMPELQPTPLKRSSRFN